jgi:hypothetical protein
MKYWQEKNTKNKKKTTTKTGRESRSAFDVNAS